MIRKLPFMLIALCFLLSCGGDPLNIEPDPLQPEKPYIPEEPDPFQGYLVKNREGLKNIAKELYNFCVIAF